jgi:hypothetical protein
MAKITEKDLKSNFKLFVIYVWSLLGLPPPTRVQLMICDFMSDDTNPKRIIEAFRGVGKSYICYAFVVWKLWNDPNLKFLVVSGSSRRANAFSSTCQQFIELVPQLQHLKPTDRDTKWTKIEWTVAGAGVSGSASVVSMGITAQMTGSRADYIIADDVENQQNSFTVDQREKLRSQVTEFAAIKKGNEGDGKVSQVIYLGTPQCEESLYNHLADSGYKCRIWPARYPRMDKVGDYRGKLCPVLEDELYRDESLVGEPTDSKRFTEADLVERELEYGKAGFSLQFMLDTALSDAERFPLRTSDLVVFQPAGTKAPRQLSHAKNKENCLQNLPRIGFSADKWYKPIFVDDEYLPWEGSILAVDPSGRGTDETGYAVIKMLMGTLYVTRAGGLNGGYDEDSVLKPLAMIAKEEGVQKVIIESNFGDGMFLHLFKPIVHAIYPVTMEEVRHHTNKERRIIDTLEPVMARHKLVVSPQVIEDDYKSSFEAKDAHGKLKTAYSLFYQMTRITQEKGAINHDDRLDALAIGVAYYTERMARNADLEIHRMKEAVKDAIIKKKLKGREKPNSQGLVGGTLGKGRDHSRCITGMKPRFYR